MHLKVRNKVVRMLAQQIQTFFFIDPPFLLLQKYNLFFTFLFSFSLVHVNRHHLFKII